MARYKWLVLVLVLALALTACAKKETVPVEEDIDKPIVEPPPPPPPIEEPEEPIEVEEAEPVVLEDVFFDFDKFNIKDEYKKVLAANAEALLSNSEAKLLVEGHCDERGTNEYNIALGEKRAKAVLDFYITYGVEKYRLSMVSYGEESPFAHGSSESAWAKNRRAHMVVK